jgi:acid stress-induced BolA-like protein IbaG/YrbA
MRPEQIRELILLGLPDAEVEVRGEDGAHFEARVVSPQFVGRRTLDRHRMVYAALGTRVGAEIHALALATLAPGEAG